MTAYNRTWLDALATREAAGRWFENGLLSDEKWQAVQERYRTGFYTPNVFVRIGLAVFCLILLLATVGLTTLMLNVNSESGFAVFSIFWGLAWIAALELIVIGIKNHYGSGLDDMLLYAGVTAVVSGLYMLLPGDTGTVAYFLLALPFLAAGSIRYLDRLMAAAAFVCALAILLLIVKDVPGGAAIYLLPASGMLFSLVMYDFARRGSRIVSWRYWSGVLAVVEMLSLVLFYASGNYWVVQQAGQDMFAMEKPPLGWLFWAFTFIVPGVYIFQGLRARDRLLIDFGIGSAVAAILAFRYYFNVLPFAWAAAIGGAVLFAVAYFSIRRLNRRAGAFAYHSDSKSSILQKAQEQIFEQTIAGQSVPAPAKKNTLEGGQFGGGGSGGDF